MTNTEIMERIAGDEGTEVIVAKIATGFSVALRDVEADEIVPTITIYPTFERAHAAAAAIAAGKAI